MPRVGPGSLNTWINTWVDVVPCPSIGPDEMAEVYGYLVVIGGVVPGLNGGFGGACRVGLLMGPVGFAVVVNGVVLIVDGGVLDVVVRCSVQE